MNANGRICRLHAVIDGTKYEPGPIKASEAEKILAWTGLKTLREWEGEVANGDPLAARALIALFRFRAGEHVRFSDIEIDDVDTIEADLRDEQGRVLGTLQDDRGRPIVRNGKQVFLFDGEEDTDPQTAASLTA